MAETVEPGALARPGEISLPAHSPAPYIRRRPSGQLSIARAADLPRFAQGVERTVAEWRRERRAQILDITGLRERFGINEVFARQLAAALLEVRS